MITRLLIANRGEIACRIIKTAKQMGITTIAIYSAADTHAKHVKLADESYFVGASQSNQSYLNQQNIINIAKKAHVDAIHPGYGFLAENAEFAERCKKNQIIFIGPSAKAIAAMGSKSQAKKIMDKAGIPLIPGYHDKKNDLKTLLSHAKSIGFPVLLKASAGGGGKAMRKVNNLQEFDDAFHACQREAKASFDDEQLILEKYIENPRHIEIQIFADQHDNAIYLYERDCSIQRRHQKVIEEAPACKIDDKLRQVMGEMALRAAKAIQYEGAGTIEFLVDNKHNFYFMEMNTRLQVEHPVTEMITKLDLVELQIKVANGEKLNIKQSDVKRLGCAIEARVYAENPHNQFLPSIGTLTFCKFPSKLKHIRVDSGVSEGDTISPYYDPMLAKIIAYGETRSQAIHYLKQALMKTYIAGVETNISFLYKILNTPSYEECTITTHFIDTHQNALTDQFYQQMPLLYVLASVYQIILQRANKTQISPWNFSDAWKMNLPANQILQFIDHDKKINVEVIQKQEALQVKVFDQTWDIVEYHLKDHKLNLLTIDNQQYSATLTKLDEIIYLFLDDIHYRLQCFDPNMAYEYQEERSGNLNAPMPGTIIAIFAKPGETVTRGAKLMIIEAMKMEHVIQAPTDGVVKEIFYNTGDMVQEGNELISLEQ